MPVNYTGKDLKLIRQRREYNHVISDYYLRYAEEFEQHDFTYLFGNGSKKKTFARLHHDFQNRAQRVKGCYTYFRVDHYKSLRLKDVRSVTLCKDRFCMNCQATLADLRQAKYRPVLEQYADRYELFHVVFTVPNVPYAALQDTLDRMYESYYALNCYLKGKIKIKDLDFGQFGYAGSIRSLEITYNLRTKTFHPHFHCILALKKGIVLEKNISNVFSWKKGKDIRRFSYFEILMQKIWMLLMMKVRITASALETVDHGYDVVADPAEGHYHEIFKYALKSSVDVDSDRIFDYDAFVALFWSMYNRRILQPYGCFYGIDFDDLSSEDAVNLYWLVKQLLERIERPEEVDEVLSDFFNNQISGEIYFSKRLIKKQFFEDWAKDYAVLDPDCRDFYLRMIASRIVSGEFFDKTKITAFDL